MQTDTQSSETLPYTASKFKRRGLQWHVRVEHECTDHRRVTLHKYFYFRRNANAWEESIFESFDSCFDKWSETL